MPFEFRQPTTPEQQTNHAAERLHELAFSGQPADDKMRQEVQHLNQQFAGNKGALSKISNEYKVLSKNDALFSQEVKIGADGTLTFTANDVISKELRGFSVTAAKELKSAHQLDRKIQRDQEAGNYKQLELDEKSWTKLTKELTRTQIATEHEEHLLAAAPMDPKDVVINGVGYNQFQRTAMQNLVDKSLAASNHTPSKNPYSYYEAQDLDVRQYDQSVPAATSPSWDKQPYRTTPADQSVTDANRKWNNREVILP